MEFVFIGCKQSGQTRTRTEHSDSSMSVKQCNSGRKPRSRVRTFHVVFMKNQYVYARWGCSGLRGVMLGHPTHNVSCHGPTAVGHEEECRVAMLPWILRAVHGGVLRTEGIFVPTRKWAARSKIGINGAWEKRTKPHGITSTFSAWRPPCPVCIRGGRAHDQEQEMPW